MAPFLSHFGVPNTSITTCVTAAIPIAYPTVTIFLYPFLLLTILPLLKLISISHSIGIKYLPCTPPINSSPDAELTKNELIKNAICTAINDSIAAPKNTHLS